MRNGERLGIELQPRDYVLLRGLFESRVMTLAHAATLYFSGKKEMAKKRVQKLKAAGLVRERPRQFAEPSALFLSRKALELLRDHGHLADYPKIALPSLEKRARVSDLTLRHELQVMDVKTALATAINQTQAFHVAEFTTWPALHQFRACQPRGKRVAVKPDGFIRIHENEPDGGISEQTFFLEVDRSTETLDILSQRCHCYLDYYRSGEFAVRSGGTREVYKEYPFRVLIVCKSEERRDNVAKRLLDNNPPIGAQVWLTTVEEIKRSPLTAIWTCPIDYRDATAGLSLDPYRSPGALDHKRPQFRDRHSDDVIHRRALIDNLPRVTLDQPHHDDP